MEDDKKPNKKPTELIDEIEGDLDRIHADLVNDAIQIGYAKQKVQATREWWKEIEKKNINDDLVETGKQFLESYSQELRSVRNGVEKQSQQILTLTTSASSIYTSTASTVFFDKIITVPPSDKAFELDRPNDSESIIRRLNRLDPVLAETYGSISEALYATRSDSVRSALWAARQTLDHFFEILSPNDELRKFYNKTDEEKITRSERVNYAIRKHISNHYRATTLSASTKHINNVYDRLNKAHAREQLDSEIAKSVLREVQSIINEWVVSLSL